MSQDLQTLLAQTLLEATPQAVVAVDEEQTIRFANPAAERVFGYAARELIGQPLEILLPEDARAGHRGLVAGFAAGEEQTRPMGERSQIRGRRRDGSVFPAEGSITRIQAGGDTFLVAMLLDISQRLELEEEHRRLAEATEQTPDMVWITDREGRVEYANAAFEEVTGYSREEAQGQKVARLLKSGYHDEAFYERLWATLNAGEAFREVFTNRSKDGHLIHIDETIAPLADSAGHVTHFIVTGRDITQRLELEERLQNLVYYDPLTGVANRSLMEDRLNRAIERHQRYGGLMAVAFLDLDRFHTINDTLGHGTGDELIRQVANRLHEHTRSTDTVARLGGDDFVIILDPIRDMAQAAAWADTFLRLIDTPFELSEEMVTITASIGLALFPGDGEDPESLIKHADTATYQAKQVGRNQYAFYAHSLSEAANRRFTTERQLRRALADDGVEAFFQPQVAAGTGRIVAAEALARCQTTEGEWLSPGQFIPVAEETGLIHDLGERILAQACQRLVEWEAGGLPLERISVNLSPVQLRAPDFSERVESVLAQTGADPRRLELEITEESFLQQEEEALRQLGHLQELGVDLALDDFGTGYSSPAYLRRIPASRLKVDLTFVRGIDTDRSNQIIVDSLLVLAEGFGFRVTAEGVETPGQLAFLQEEGCHVAQGFYFGHPQPAEAFAADWLAG